MIRRFNYTGRRKIPSEGLRFRLHRNGSGMSFDAEISGLEKIGVPSSALVFVEAYYQAAYMRFDYGTVGQVQIPPDRCLVAFYDGSPVLFRVKIVNSLGEAGRIMAVADRLQPLRDDDDSNDNSSLHGLFGAKSIESWCECKRRKGVARRTKCWCPLRCIFLASRSTRGFGIV